MCALSILDRMDIIDSHALAWWLSERQLPNGGLNGRPEKLEDVSGWFRDLMRVKTKTCIVFRYAIAFGRFQHSQC